MYADFDTLAQIITTNSHSIVHKEATGYDVEFYLKQRRKEIKNISSYVDFLHFLNRSITYAFTPHIRMAKESDCAYALGVKFVDTAMLRVVSQAYKAYNDSILSTMHPMEIAFKNYGLGFYYNGNYYVSGRYILMNKDYQDSLILTNFRIIRRSNQLIDIFEREVKNADAVDIRWDYRLKKYYVPLGLTLPRNERLLVEDYTTKKQIDYSGDAYPRRNISNISLSEEEMSVLHREESDRFKITCYDSLELLYIYMGAMIYDARTFANSVKEAGAGKKITNIIIDIRENGGGNDEAWRQLLSVIVSKPLFDNTVLGVRNTPSMQKVFEDLLANSGISPNSIRKEKIPYLNNEEYLLLSSGINEAGDSLAVAIPDSNSLMYDGTIYILQDERVYSSAGAFAAYAQQLPQLVTVGVPTGLIAGRGLVPAVFQLPNSKFSFLMEIFVDLTNAKTAADVFHDRPEIEIYPTIDEIIEMNNYGRFLNKRGDEFLFKHDYLFKKVLELIKQEQK
jgi:hypothetical protein